MANPSVRALEAALSGGDYDRAFAECLALAGAVPAPAATAAVLQTLAAQVLSAPEGRRPEMAQAGLEALRNALGPEQVDAQALAVGDIYLLAGLRQEGLEFFRRAYRQDPTAPALAH